MADLQSRLTRDEGDVRLVSFSVDPENDTPPVLFKYAADAHADPARGSFITGGADDVQKAVVVGFKMSAAKIDRGANDYDVVHGDWFVLVDRKGAIRGYYPTGTDAEFATLVQDVRRLER
jgi:protein SCO1/2